MNRLIRSALVVALGLGMNVLCTGAWEDGGGRGPGDRKACVESIWSLP
jgi:hypothetical protein